jgi:hypothetical protein
MGSDMEGAPVKLPAECTSAPRRVTPRRNGIAVSVVVLIGIVSAAWWSWRRISLGLTAVYDEGLHKTGMLGE